MIVIAKLRIQPGKETEFEEAVKDALPKVEQEKGTLVYRFNRSVQNPSTFVFYEKYADQSAFTHHAGTDYFRALSKTMAPLLSGPPEIEMFEEIAAIREG